MSLDKGYPEEDPPSWLALSFDRLRISSTQTIARVHLPKATSN